MKRAHAVLLPAFVLAVAIIPNCSHAQATSPTSSTSGTTGQPLPPPTPYQVVNQGANNNVWERTTYEKSPSGQIVPRKHHYTELATGLNYLQNGQWVASREEIDIQPDGTAAATNGQHQAYFPGDIYEGQIELVTPDGLHLKSRPVGLSYDDGTNSVLIAELTNSIGVVAGNNQVIYPDAFTGFKADLRYTYTKAGFEQDIILREQPPTPESLGLNPDTARLQVLTEFFDPPQPAVTTAIATTAAGNLTDEQLDFGVMRMARGRAFLLGNEANDVQAPVNKQWLLLDGRQILVEEVPVDAIAGGLATLPLPTAQSGSSATTHIVSRHLNLPPQRLAKSTTRPMMLARTSVPTQGLVLDYNAVNGSMANYTFQGDTTYYISGAVSLSGVNTIEGGAVLKYTNSGSIYLSTGSAGLVSEAGLYQMAVLTSMNDDSVGQIIANSTGNPTIGGTYLNVNVMEYATSPLSYLRFAYAGTALEQVSEASYYTGIFTVWNCQFVNCGTAITDWDYYNENTLNQKIYNVLFSHCGTAVYNAQTTYSGDMAVSGQNVTADQVTNFLWTWGADNYAPSSTLTNSILTGVTYPIYYLYSSGSSYSGNFITNDCYIGSGSGVYQSAGANNYYLTNGSPFRDVGTTNIDPALLAEIQTMTTYAPQDGGFPDTNTPDLGYHYPIIPNDSTGTDFWLAFSSLYDYGDNVLSLYISSPVGATGTVGFFTNGPILVVTNCGDTSVNGTYVLTNLTGQVLSASMSYFGDSNETNGYMKGADWVIYDGGGWVMLEYDSGADAFTGLYLKSGLNLNGISDDWESDGDTNPPPTPTTFGQIPFNQPFTVAAGAVTNVIIPLQDMIIHYDKVETNGIHITASQPVSVYAMDYRQFVSAAFTCYPTTLLGTNYCVMARAANSSGIGTSEFAIVATADDTTVTITPSTNADLIDGYTAAYSTNLNQGETYQIGSANGVGDVTGTLIKSDKPIAVFAGASDADVPDGRTASANPLVQEQLPVEQWGTNVLALSFAGRLNGDTYRVLAASNNTVITITGNVVTPVDESVSPWSVTTNYETLTITNQAGEFFETNIDGPVQFQSTKPIQVAQFANGEDSDVQEGDPSEILLPPAGQYLTSYTVYTSTNDGVTGDFDENYLNLIVPQSGTNTVLLDGTLVTATDFVPIGSSGYYGAQLSVTNGGAHTVTSSQPIEVQVYGFGNADAYSYFGGLTK